MHAKHHELPHFVIGAVRDPEGFKPGLYYVVVHLDTGRKVSRYVRRMGTAIYKAAQYEASYAKGERYWPEVNREHELRDSRYVVRTIAENFRQWAKDTFAPAMKTRSGLGCGDGSCAYMPVIRS